MIKYRLKESDDDEKPEPETTGGGGNREKIDYDIFLTPKGKSLDDVIKALKDIENYGTYVSNMRSKASVEDAIVKHFGPTVPVKKKQLEKEMGKPFPMKTKQAIDDLVKSLTSRPTLLSYHKEGDELVFPKQWGKKRGALELIRQRLAMDEETLRDAAESIGNMLQVLNEVEEWPDDRINKWNTKPSVESDAE